MRMILKVSLLCLVSGSFGIIASSFALSATGSIVASYIGAGVAGAVVGLALGMSGVWED